MNAAQGGPSGATSTASRRGRRGGWRARLFLPAIVAARCNPLVRAKYERLLAAGKTKMSALAVAMRKLVHIAFGVLKHQKPFDPNNAA